MVANAGETADFVPSVPARAGLSYLQAALMCARAARCVRIIPFTTRLPDIRMNPPWRAFPVGIF